MKYILLLILGFFSTEAFCQTTIDTTFKLNGDTVINKKVTTQKTFTYPETLLTTIVRPKKVVGPINKPPVSNAGGDKVITLPVNSVTLSGNGTDTDGSITKYLWSSINNVGTIATPNAPKTVISNLPVGKYIYRLTVTDNSGATAIDDVGVTINQAASQPPTANGGANVSITLPINYLVLRGAGIASVGKTIASSGWSFVSGPASYTIDNPSLPDCGFGSLAQGVYVFRYTVTDNTGLVGTDDVTVTVNAVAVTPPPPVDTTQPPPTSGKGYLSLPVSQATTYNNVNGLVIDGRRFSNINNAVNQNGNILRFFNCQNITIRNCFFGEASGGDLGGDRAIYFNACSNITVENCLFSDQGGAILVSSHGNGVVIRNNEFMNVRGPYPKGNFIQFNTCNGSGYLIEKNRGENFYGESYPEDIISMYSTSGTVASPIIVQDNLWRGGGSSTTGGGGTFGDHGGSNIIYQRNKSYNPGQYGLGVGGGNNHKVLNNWIWQEQKPWSANGIVAFAYSPPCTNVTIQGNMVHAVCGLSIRCTLGVVNNTYFPNECTFIGDPKAGVTDFTNVALMNFPAKLITYISEDEIWQLRHSTKKHEALMISTAQKPPQNWTAQSISRPTANATFSLAQGIYTLRSLSTASVGNSISSVRWVLVSGPNTPTMSAPNAAVNNISGLVTGTYVFRLEVIQMNNVALKVETADAAWVTINN